MRPPRPLPPYRMRPSKVKHAHIYLPTGRRRWPWLGNFPPRILLPLKCRFNDSVAFGYSIPSDFHNRFPVQILSPLLPVHLPCGGGTEADTPEAITGSSVDELTLPGGFEALQNIRLFIRGEMELEGVCSFCKLETLWQRVSHALARTEGIDSV